MKFADITNDIAFRKIIGNENKNKYFIKNAENLPLIPDSVKDEGLKEAYTEANQQNWTKEELEEYQRASIKERDEIGRIEFAEKNLKQDD